MLTHIKQTPLRSGRVTHLKRRFSKNIYMFVTNVHVFGVSKLILWYLKGELCDSFTNYNYVGNTI